MNKCANEDVGLDKIVFPRLKSMYRDFFAAEMQKMFGYTNFMMIPKISKIVINMGVGEAVLDSKKITAASGDLALIACQKPVITRAKQSLAGFKLRKGMPLGAKVVLRNNQMYYFMDRFVNIALPRVRDFRGLNPKSFDGRGNYMIGVKEHTIFPEINYDKTDSIWGLDIAICTTANTDGEAIELLKLFGFPFRRL